MKIALIPAVEVKAKALHHLVVALAAAHHQVTLRIHQIVAVALVVMDQEVEVKRAAVSLKNNPILLRTGHVEILCLTCNQISSMISPL